MAIIDEITRKVIERFGPGAFQYDLTEGFMPLREVLTGLLRDRGIEATSETVHIASGSQEVLDGLVKILITKGDAIAVEAPTYLGAISAFNPYEPEYVRMETDEGGLIPESLEEVLSSRAVKFIYLVPTFQNPTGRSIPMDRRRAIADIIIRHDALLVEDDPYSALRYRGDFLPPIKTLAPDNVVYISTLSKVFAPGLRIGFSVSPEVIRKWLVLVKQGVDLHTSTFNQALAAEYVRGGYLERHLPFIIDLYRPRQAAMEAAIREFFPPGFTVSPSDGGMFLWVTGPEGYDMTELYRRAIRENVAFVPGTFFYPGAGEGLETMRLNYTMADEETLRGVVRTLAGVIGQGKARCFHFPVNLGTRFSRNAA
jgi:2-aminoadipate transaminase